MEYRYKRIGVKDHPLFKHRSFKHVEEHRVIMAEGLPQSHATRRKRSQTMTGRKFTPEHCENIRRSHLGYVHSAEARAKLSRALKGRKKSAETRARMVASWTPKRRRQQAQRMRARTIR